MSATATPNSVVAVVKDGQIVLPPGVEWPDGATVRIEVVKKEEEVKKDRPTVWDVLKKYSGVVDDLPPDAAENHDHYLYGHPKKTE